MQGLIKGRPASILCLCVHCVAVPIPGRRQCVLHNPRRTLHFLNSCPRRRHRRRRSHCVKLIALVRVGGVYERRTVAPAPCDSAHSDPSVAFARRGLLLLLPTPLLQEARRRSRTLFRGKEAATAMTAAITTSSASSSSSLSVQSVGRSPRVCCCGQRGGGEGGGQRIRRRERRRRLSLRRRRLGLPKEEGEGFGLYCTHTQAHCKMAENLRDVDDNGDASDPANSVAARSRLFPPGLPRPTSSSSS